MDNVNKYTVFFDVTTALFIRNLIVESKPDKNCYLDAAVNHFCRGLEWQPQPIRPAYLTDKLIQNIKFVIAECDKQETKVIYKVLLEKEFNITDDFKFKVENDNQGLNFENAVYLTNSRLFPVKVRSTLWKHFHNVIFNEVIKGKIKNCSPVCKPKLVVSMVRP